MFCEDHQLKLEYFSILKISSYYGKLLCQDCIINDKRLRFNENYFSLYLLQSGQLANLFQNEISNLNQHKEKISIETLIEFVNDVFFELNAQILQTKENIIDNINEKYSIELISTKALSKVRNLKNEQKNISNSLYSSQTDREKLAQILSEIKEHIHRGHNLAQNESHAIQKIIHMKLKLWVSEVKNSLLKINMIMTEENNLINIAKELNNEIYYVSPNFEELNHANNLITKDLLNESVENYGVLSLNNHSLLYTCTSKEGFSKYLFRLWDAHTLKPKIRKINSNCTWPLILTRKKKYLINIENYNSAGPHFLGCLSISQVTAKGIKKLALIRTRILSHIECFEEFDNIVAAEKLVVFVYNIRTRKNIQKIILSDTISALKYMPILDYLLIGSSHIQVYNVANGNIGSIKYTLEPKGFSLAQIQVDYVRNYIYCFHSDNAIRIWKLTKEDYSMISQYKVDISPAEVYTFPEKNIFIGTSFDDSLTCVSMKNGKTISKILGIDKILGVIPKGKDLILFLVLIGSELTIKVVSNKS